MQLQYPFPDGVRSLFVGCWECWNCGSNGTGCGGLELHHIFGRVSCSAFNGSILCHDCHDSVQHTVEEHRRLFSKTFVYLHEMAQNGLFSLSEEDDRFIRLVFKDIKDQLSTLTS